MYDTYFVNRVLNIYYNRKYFNLNVELRTILNFHKSIIWCKSFILLYTRNKTNNIDKLVELLDTKFNKTRFDGYFNKSYDNLKI